MKRRSHAWVVLVWVLLAAGCEGSSTVETQVADDPAVEAEDDLAEASPSAEQPGSQAIDSASLIEMRGRDVHEVEFFACGVSWVANGYLMPFGATVTTPAAMVGNGVFIVRPDGVTIQLPLQDVSANGLGFASPALFDGEVGPIAALAPDQTYVALYRSELGADLQSTELSGGSGTASQVEFTVPGTAEMLGAPVFDLDTNFVGTITATGERSVTVASIEVALDDRGDVSRSCPDEPAGTAVTAEHLQSVELRALSLAQELASALAADNWGLVRQLEPARADYTDNQFIEGWGMLNESILVPVSWDFGGGPVRVRALLVAHETEEREQITKLFCISWDVFLDGAQAGTVVETFDNTKNGLDPASEKYDSRLETLPSWVDPLEASMTALAACE